MRVKQPIDHTTEADVEKRIATALTTVGFKVLKTSGIRTKGAYGLTKGIPDRLAFIPGANICIGLEIKKSAKAPRKPEQVALNESGCYIVAWSVENALSGAYGVLEALESRHSAIVPIMRNIKAYQEATK